jgi:streptomycin 6-kinase
VTSVAIPEVVQNLARTTGADAWLAALPGLLDRLQDEWSLTLDTPYEDATEAYVAAATLADGTPAVLKVLVQRPGGSHTAEELTVLRLAAGQGCVELLRYDEAGGAMLLERLGPSMYRLRVPIAERHEILCRVAQRLWRPAPGVDLPTGADRARELIAYVETHWEALGRPCSEAAVDQALAAGRSRIAAHDDERAVLVHGDVHQWNTLRAGGDWKLVDPDGLRAEPEYDLGVLMREDPLELMTGDPRDRSRWLAARTGRDETAIWEWGLVNRLQNGLSCLAVDLEPYGTHCLAAADRIAGLAG